ncbi:hypothetical protein QP816_08630 [Staphylococcus condimenti]|uniref:hypothetical protein n=1 Tax=Staphylococcus condimenti TaxID=70255 RepID=UPI0025503797|nr:hypothetical protein [Staphylococcus condimenti]MDK8645655.1 hypothetical protein [Staphylococcus condimenti]
MRIIYLQMKQNNFQKVNSCETTKCLIGTAGSAIIGSVLGSTGFLSGNLVGIVAFCDI